MKILFLNWNSFGNEDIIPAFRELKHEVIVHPFAKIVSVHDAEWEKGFTATLRAHVPDFVFSFAYFPIVSKVCQAEGILYVSWVYDSPHVALYSYTMINSCNRVFIFDKELCLSFIRSGFKNVFYLPMAANTSRLDAMLEAQSPDVISRYSSDISLVGSLYSEPKHNLYSRITSIRPYVKGYLDALIQAQMMVYGYNFIEEALTPQIIEELLQSDYSMRPSPTGVESSEYLYAQYVLNRHVTSLEREKILRLLGQLTTVDLYTHDSSVRMEGVRNHGPVDYYDTMPYVFNNSKINLNISLRSIQSGIPLRAFDIMGCGGFLLSNYQADFLDFFVPGEDFVFYDNIEQVKDLAAYYLAHDDEREAIRKCGHRKIQCGHTYKHRLEEIFSVL